MVEEVEVGGGVSRTAEFETVVTTVAEKVFVTTLVIVGWEMVTVTVEVKFATAP